MKPKERVSILAEQNKRAFIVVLSVAAMVWAFDAPALAGFFPLAWYVARPRHVPDGDLIQADVDIIKERQDLLEKDISNLKQELRD